MCVRANYRPRARNPTDNFRNRWYCPRRRKSLASGLFGDGNWQRHDTCKLSANTIPQGSPTDGAVSRTHGCKLSVAARAVPIN